MNVYCRVKYVKFVYRSQYKLKCFWIWINFINLYDSHIILGCICGLSLVIHKVSTGLLYQYNDLRNVRDVHTTVCRVQSNINCLLNCSHCFLYVVYGITDYYCYFMSVSRGLPFHVNIVIKRDVHEIDPPTLYDRTQTNIKS